MATASVLLTIDQIVERANKVKVCQDHLKLITTSLTRLRQRLTTLDETFVQGKLEDLLKTIDEIVNNCIENENRSMRMTCKDLESTLLRLHYRLAQYQCTLTHHCETNVQILSNALKEQRLCLFNSSNEISKQRSDELEQQTKTNMAEKHFQLREKYSEIIDSYLESCIEQYQWISIPSLTCDMIIKVAKTFYKISSEEQIIFQKKWKTFELPIKKELIQLKGDSLINEEHLIPNQRSSVILGEAGSGKTSFARWIVYSLAQTLLNKQSSTNEGPPRIPIYISIDKFAQMCQEESSLTLFDYIGKIDPSSILSNLFQLLIQQGLALIIIDGIDQISTSEQGLTIISALEHFHDKYSSFDQSEGNQLIVMCRSGTPHTSRLTQLFPSYILQPFNQTSINSFISHYLFHVHQLIVDQCSLSSPNQSINISQLFQRKDLLQIYSNPRLLSYICNLSFNQQIFPHQDYLLLHYLIKTIFNQSTIVDHSQLMTILTDISSFINQHSPSNRIDLHQIKQISTKTIKHSEKEMSEIVYLICHQLGILTFQDESYSFVYSSFEEYFLSLKLIQFNSTRKQKFVLDEINLENEIRSFLCSISGHTFEQRYRSSIVLALANLSSSWSQGSFDDLCYELIQSAHPSDSLYPYYSFLLIYSLDQFVKCPSNDILFIAFNRLLVSAVQHRSFLLYQMTNLINKCPKPIVSSWLKHFLSSDDFDSIETIKTFSQLIQLTDQQIDQSSSSILQYLSTLHHQFEIDQLLIQISLHDHQSLPCPINSLKSFLLQNSIEMKSIPVVVHPLIISLYGGLTRNGTNILFNAQHISRESSLLTPLLIKLIQGNLDENQLKQQCLKLFVERIEKEDQSVETIDLCLSIVCLDNIEYIQNNFDRLSKSFVSLCLNRLKSLSMILRQIFVPLAENDQTIENATTQFISMSIQSYGTRFAFINLFNSLKRTLTRLRSSSGSIFFNDYPSNHRLTLTLPLSLSKDEQFLTNLLINDIQFSSTHHSCSLIQQFVQLFPLLEHNDQFETSSRMFNALETIPSYLLFRHDEDLLTSFTFVPSHLTNLFIRLLKQNFIEINSNESIRKGKDHLPLSHILVECLFFLSNPSVKRLSLLYGLIELLPWLTIQHLEDFSRIVLYPLSSLDSILLDIYHRKSLCPINTQTGKYFLEDQFFFKGTNLEIGQVQSMITQHIEQLRLPPCEEEEDMKLYCSSICLSLISRWRNELFDQSLCLAMKIINPLIRLDVLCGIALFSSFDLDKVGMKTDRSLKEEIEYELNELYPSLPLLVQTTMFIRCYPIVMNGQVLNDCLNNLMKKMENADQRDRQSVIECLFPYIESNEIVSSVIGCSSLLKNEKRHLSFNSPIMKKYLCVDVPSYSLILSSLYLLELTKDLNSIVEEENRLIEIETRIFPIGHLMLTVEQCLTIINILLFVESRSGYSQVLKMIDKGLGRMKWIEFKSFHLVQSWLKCLDKEKMNRFIHHGSILLMNSGRWSVESVEVLCEMLCGEEDDDRRRSSMICSCLDEDEHLLSSIIGIDVLVILLNKRNYFRLKNVFVSMKLNELIGNITIDVKYHLETLLCVERERIHLLNNREYRSEKLNCYVPRDVPLEECCVLDSFDLCPDLVFYLIELIDSDLSMYLPLNGDSTSKEVLESHEEFVISLLINLKKLLNKSDEVRERSVNVLMKLFERSVNEKKCQSIVEVVGYVSNGKTSKKMFNKIVWILNGLCYGNSRYSIETLCSLISSYFYCLSMNEMSVDQDDLDLFNQLFQHSNVDVVKSVRVGFSRLCLSLIESDEIECYEGLMGATSSWYVDPIQERNENNLVQYLEEHPNVLSIFLIELIDHLRDERKGHFPYGYPRYLTMGGLIGVRMGKIFVDKVKELLNEDELKEMLFERRKVNHLTERGGCLMIMSILGELTIELCQMLMEGIFDHPFIQNKVYQSIKFIRYLKDEKNVLNLLNCYFKSASMNVRYVTVLIVIHLCQLCLIKMEEVKSMLNEVMLDSSSNEDLWLIKEEEERSLKYEYVNVGPLKDVIYSILVEYISGERINSLRNDRLNDIHLDFIQSEKVSRFSSCVFERKSDEIST